MGVTYIIRATGITSCFTAIPYSGPHVFTDYYFLESTIVINWSAIHPFIFINVLFLLLYIFNILFIYHILYFCVVRLVSILKEHDCL